MASTDGAWKDGQERRRHATARASFPQHRLSTRLKNRGLTRIFPKLPRDLRFRRTFPKLSRCNSPGKVVAVVCAVRAFRHETGRLSPCVQLSGVGYFHPVLLLELSDP